MWLSELRVVDFRCFSSASAELGSGHNWLVGPNGAGKTSVLEAVFHLGAGRSFRGGERSAVIRRGAEGFVVSGRLCTGEQALAVGLQRDRSGVRARIDGQWSDRLVDLIARVPVCSFDPESHHLVSGSAEARRQYLDWILFHVEPGFLRSWQRYRHALKQRNRLLKTGGSAAEFRPWEIELGTHGLVIDRQRRWVCSAVVDICRRNAALFLPELGEMELSYEPGWRGEGDLGEQLASGRARDLQRGMTSVGPHRADLRIAFEAAPDQSHLSRGQSKLTALSLVMSQAEALSEQRGEWPILLMDDLPSELDRGHFERTLARLRAIPTQCLLTTTLIDACSVLREEDRLFHVEQGRVQAAATPGHSLRPVATAEPPAADPVG